MVETIKKERHPTALAIRAPKCRRLSVSLARSMIARMFEYVNGKFGPDLGRRPFPDRNLAGGPLSRVASMATCEALDHRPPV